MNGKDPLTPEERELARLLAPDPDAGPSPALDARILAAARAGLDSAAPAASDPPVASVASPNHRPAASVRRPRRRRWPAALGLAASVTLAIGVAWQLREPPRPEAVVAASADAGHVAGSADTDPVQAKVASREADAVVSGYAAAPAAVPVDAAPALPPPAETEGPPPAAVARTRAAVAQKQAGAERAARLEAPPFAPPSPPAPPAPAAPASVALPAPPADGGSSSSAAAPEPAQVLEVGAPAPAAADVAPSFAPAPQAAADAGKASATVAKEAPDEDAARWLQRIRLQRDQGDLDGARVSLARFVRSHPGLAVPEDLRPLLAPPL